MNNVPYVKEHRSSACVTIGAMARAQRRRSTEEVRELSRRAARELFAERGYAQTTMRDVASAAGIGLSVLYRQFPSKGRLFSATFAAPFVESFEHFGPNRDGAQDSALDDEALVGNFIRDLHENLATSRRTIVTLLAALENPDAETVADLRETLGEVWRRLEIAAPGLDGEAVSPEDARDANILVVAMVAGLVLFQPWVDAAREDGDDQALVELAGSFCAAGIRASTSA